MNRDFPMLNTSNYEVVFIEEEHAHESFVRIHTKWVNDVTLHSDMHLNIAVKTSDDGTEEVRTLGLHYMLSL